MDDTRAIQVGVSTDKERRRRRRELILAGVLFVLIMVLSIIELRYLGVNSFLFLALFNLNFILLLLVLFLVIRNSVKLILERRRKVLGARLRTRLVVAFISLSLIPTVLMFLVGAKFVQTSVDYWFKVQLENSMEEALDVGRAFYASARERLKRRSETILELIRVNEFAWGGTSMDSFLEQKRVEYDLTMLGVINPDGSQQNWHTAKNFSAVWKEVEPKINWESLKDQPGFWSLLWQGPASDQVVGIMPVDEGKTGYLAAGENIGRGLMYKLDRIVRGAEEYKKLRTLKYPLKMALYFIMALLTLLIIFGAMWFGFRMAKELSAPIQALAEGTERVARGDLSVRLEDTSSDELGILVRSFNRMARDLEQSRTRLTEANIQLGRQNMELERRGRYIEAVLDNIAAGVISIDDKGIISTVNKAASEMLGIKASLIKGKRPTELLRGDFSDMLNEALKRLTDSPGSMWQRQVDIRIRGEDKRLLVNIVALTSPGEGVETGVVAVFEDITELEKMQRMAAWREVARRIAHEIKNPLTPIKLSAQRLERKFAEKVDDKAFGQSTELIVRQVEHLQQMVQEFSAFAKLPEAVLRNDFPAPLLEEVFALFAQSHAEIDWNLKFKTEIPKSKFDREGIRRVLINILTNAVEALDNKEGEKRIRVTAEHSKRLGKIFIEVTDTGPGLQPDEKAGLFEPYFSGKKGGTGLGLSIVKSIISDHHGYVRAESTPGKGTTIILELPAGE